MKNLLIKAFGLLLIVSIISACSSGSNGTSGPKEKESASENSNVNGNEGSIEEEITFRVSSGLAEVHAWFPVFFYPWMEKINEESGGKITFDLHSGGSLVPIKGELDALHNGTIDIAMPLWPIYEPSRFPLSEVTMLPLTKTDAIIAAKAYQQLLNSDVELADGKTFKDIDFTEHDLKVFEIPPIQSYVLSSPEQRFDSIDSFKGAILRTSGPAHEMLTQKLGGNSATIGAADLFEAVNRGTVDGIYMGIADWRSYGFDEILKYTLDGVHIGHYNAVMAMTREKWDSLPKEAQQIIQEATDTLQVPGGKKWEELGAEVKQYNIEQGGEFYHIDDLDTETRDFILTAMADTWLAWIENIEERGYPGKEVAKLWRDLIIENGGDVPDKIKEIE